MENKVTAAKPAEKIVPKRPKMSKGGARIDGRTIGLMISAALLIVLLAEKSDTFLVPYTASVISKQVAIFALIALAQAMCLVVGGMNLSVGAICSVSTVILGVCVANMHMPSAEAVIITLAGGAVIGLINGLLITGLKIDSFIVTLSMMFVYMGLRSGISGGSPYALPSSFTFIGQNDLVIPYLGQILRALPFLGARWFTPADVHTPYYIYTIPYVVIVVIAILAIMAYVFSSTVFGRRLLATGGNADAAKLSGVNTSQMIVWANVLSGVFAALAAILWASKMGSAAPETGDNWVIVTFAVAIIGGTGLNGGVISAPGIFMGGVIFALIKYLLVELRVDDYWANCAVGGLVLLAIIVDRIRETYNAKMKSAVGRRNERGQTNDKGAAPAKS